MRLWRLIRILKPAQLWKLFKLCFRHPLMIRPTLKATRATVSLSNANYGKEHHKNTPANAFRHAIWNYLIAQKCSSWSKDSQRILDWTQKITDLHEELLPNKPLAREMDLHNNKVGRKIYAKEPELSEQALVILIKGKTADSKFVSQIEELSELPEDQLAHIVEAENNEG